jgi:hypothetical protein
MKTRIREGLWLTTDDCVYFIGSSVLVLLQIHVRTSDPSLLYSKIYLAVERCVDKVEEVNFGEQLELSIAENLFQWSQHQQHMDAALLPPCFLFWKWQTPCTPISMYFHRIYKKESNLA